jgi:hypothetical protein
VTKGISTRTTSLGFHVVRLHYSSDPDKDPATEAGRLWMEQAKAGMSDAQWRKEYEIDYGALSGQLVFPEFDPAIHVVEEFKLDPSQWTVSMACDPHPRTPHAFLWLAINREGEMIVRFSWWPQSYVRSDFHATVKHYVDCVKKVEELFGWKVYNRVMDPAGKGMNADEERSYFDAYREAGIYFRPAKKNRDLSGFDLQTDELCCWQREEDETAADHHGRERRVGLANEPPPVFGVARQRDRQGPAGKGARKTTPPGRLPRLRSTRPSAVY